MEVRVTIPDPSTKGQDRLLAHLDRTFQRVSQTLTQQGQRQERVLGQLQQQQGKVLTAIAQRPAPQKPAPSMSLEGLSKLLDRQWSRTVQMLHAMKPAASPPQTIVRRVETVVRPSSASTTSPALLKRFDALAEAIRKMRPRTYGIMR